MTDIKLNGWNNNLTPAEGIGGKPPMRNIPSQLKQNDTMSKTKEEILSAKFKDGFFDDFEKYYAYEAMEEYSTQQLQSERDKINKLREALEKINQMSDPGTAEAGIIYMKNIAQSLLKIINE